MILNGLLCSIVTGITISFFIYKKRNKKTLEQSFVFYLNNKLFAVALALIMIAIFYDIMGDADSFVDVSLLTAFVVSTIISFLAIWISKCLHKRFEDREKLTTDYKGLVKKYRGTKFFELDLKEEVGKKDSGEPDMRPITVPIIVDYEWHDFDEVSIAYDNFRMYEIPEIIRDYKEELFSAHESSNVYNQLNIRVNKWRKEGRKLNLYTSRTTFFSSLITNRAMDYELKNGFSVRELLQPGPFVPDLKDSLLSNHLGINGFILSCDGYIPFIKRNDIVSIGKNTYGASVSASLKTMYALESYDSRLDREAKGIYDGIIGEIKDELKINVNNSSENLKIIAAYRDIVEGNKPQLLFIARVEKNREEIIKIFIEEIKKKHENKNLTKEEKEQEDGNTLIWIKVSDFLEAKVYRDFFTTNGIIKDSKQKDEIRLPIVPSVSASIVLSQRYLREVYNDNNFA